MNKLSAIGNTIEHGNQIHYPGIDFLFQTIDGSARIEELADCNIIEGNQSVMFNIKVDSRWTKELIKQIRGKRIRLCVFIISDAPPLFDKERLRAKIYEFLLKKSLANPRPNDASLITAESKPLERAVIPMEPFRITGYKSRLTNREVEIMDLLSRGLLYKEIAKIMGISVQTVKSHLKHIYQKLRAGNRSEAIWRFLGSM